MGVRIESESGGSRGLTLGWSSWVDLAFTKEGETVRARTAMRKIRDVLRLRWVLSLSYRQIGRSLKIGHGTVGDYVMRAQAVGLGWDEVEGMDDVTERFRIVVSKHEV